MDQSASKSWLSLLVSHKCLFSLNSQTVDNTFKRYIRGSDSVPVGIHNSIPVIQLTTNTELKHFLIYNYYHVHRQCSLVIFSVNTCSNMALHSSYRPPKSPSMPVTSAAAALPTHAPAPPLLVAPAGVHAPARIAVSKQWRMRQVSSDVFLNCWFAVIYLFCFVFVSSHLPS